MFLRCSWEEAIARGKVSEMSYCHQNFLSRTTLLSIKVSFDSAAVRFEVLRGVGLTWVTNCNTPCMNIVFEVLHGEVSKYIRFAVTLRVRLL